MTILLSSIRTPQRRFRSRRSPLARFTLTLAVISMISTLAMSTTACGVREKRENLKKCEFELRDLEIVNFGFSKVDLLVHVGVKNPNTSDVVVDRLEFELFTGASKVADGKHQENVTIPAGEDRVVKLDVTTTPGQVGSTLMKALMSGGSVDYRVQGIVYLDTILGEIPYPVNIEGNTGDVKKSDAENDL